MSLWEYKVITSGKGGFATPALLEKFLNDLGREEWEIIEFHSHPDNFLAFTGLARRTTQRDWTLQDAAAAAAKAEAEKLRAEFEAKFKAAATLAAAPAAEERAPTFLEEKSGPDDGFRKPVDTSRDDEPEAQDDGQDDWDKLTAAEEDELPSFFEAIKPHMRRNQRGPGMSVGVDYLAKKWDQTEEDLKGALAECGFIMPVDEDSKAEYVEYDGDLYWLNINRRGELWINTKEKPRPVFRAVKAQRIEIETPAPAQAKPEGGNRNPDTTGAAPADGAATMPAESADGAAAAAPADGAAGAPADGGQRPARAEQPAVALPEGTVLLAKIRPHMRRNRRGPGGSGSTSFLARALRTNEADLKTAFAGLGLTMPSTSGDKPVYTELEGQLWWLNLDSRGGLWINGREKRDHDQAPAAASGAAPAEGGEAAAAAGVPADAPAAAATTEATAAPAAPAEAAAVASEATPAVAADAAPVAPVAPVAMENAGVAATAAPVAVAEVPVAAPAAEPAATTPAADAAPTTAAPAAGSPTLAAVRLLLKETKTGAVAGKVDRVANDLNTTSEQLVASLVALGLKVPDRAREKPVFVPHGEEIVWFNAKASKFADGKDEDGEDEAEEGEDKPRRSRSRKKDGE
jgi:hypothetical protein